MESAEKAIIFYLTLLGIIIIYLSMHYQQFKAKNYFKLLVQSLFLKFKVVFFNDRTRTAFSILMFVSFISTISLLLIYKYNIRLFNTEEELSIGIGLALILTIYSSFIILILNLSSKVSNLKEKYSLYYLSIILTALLLLLKPVGRPIENYLVAFLIVVATFSYINMLINIIENRDLYKNSSALDINNNKNLSIYKRYILMIYFYIIGVLSYTMLSYLILYFPLGCSLEQRADLVKNAAYTLIPGGKSILNVENTRGVLLDFSGFVYKLIFTTSFIGLISRISLSDLVSKNDNEVIININKKDDELNNSKPETKEPLLNTNMPVTLPKKENSKRPRKRKKRKRK